MLWREEPYLNGRCPLAFPFSLMVCFQWLCCTSVFSCSSCFPLTSFEMAKRVCSQPFLWALGVDVLMLFAQEFNLPHHLLVHVPCLCGFLLFLLARILFPFFLSCSFCYLKLKCDYMTLYELTGMCEIDWTFLAGEQGSSPLQQEFNL